VVRAILGRFGRGTLQASDDGFSALHHAVGASRNGKQSVNIAKTLPESIVIGYFESTSRLSLSTHLRLEIDLIFDALTSFLSGP
jgi:hypothetical protein